MNAVDYKKNLIIGDWYIQPSLGRVSHHIKHDEINAGQIKHVEPKVIEVLLCLARQAGETLPREQILKQVWPDVVVGEEVLTRAISELRSVLGDSAKQSRYIKTIPKRGYQLLEEVTWCESDDCAPIFEAHTQPLRHNEAIHQNERALIEQQIPIFIRVLSSRKFVAGILVSCVALLAVIVSLIASNIEQSGAPHTVAYEINKLVEASDTGRSAEEIQVAVLPFANLTQGDEYSVFIAGITEDMRNALLRIPDLRVVARTSSDVFKDRAVDVKEIGAELGARYLIEGSVRVQQGTVRISVQLVDTTSGFPVWGESYDRSMLDAFAVQSEVAFAVANRLEKTLSPEGLGAINPLAYEKYLLGRHFWQQRNPESLKSAKTEFEAALVIEPNYALAHTGLADTYSFSALYADLDVSEAISLAQQHVDRAIELDADIAEAHASQGIVFDLSHEPKRAALAYERAITLKPSFSLAHMWLGNIYMELGRLQDAVTEYQYALQIDPLHPTIQQNYLHALESEGRFGDVIKLAELFYAESKNVGLLEIQLRALVDSGRYDEMLALFKFIESNVGANDEMVFSVISTLYRLGRFDLGDKILTRYPQMSSAYRMQLDYSRAITSNNLVALEVLALHVTDLSIAEIQAGGKQKCTPTAEERDGLVRYVRGVSAYLSGNISKARKYFEQANSVENWCTASGGYVKGELAFFLGETAKQLDDHTEYVKWLQQLEAWSTTKREQGWKNSESQLIRIKTALIKGDKPQLSALLAEAKEIGFLPWIYFEGDPLIRSYLDRDEYAEVLSSFILDYQQRKNVLAKTFI